MKTQEKNNNKNILNREKKIAILYRKYSRNEMRFRVNHVDHCGHFDGMSTRRSCSSDGLLESGSQDYVITCFIQVLA